jgi:hypothetical protein
VRLNAKDVRSNVALNCLFEQGRTLARKGVSGERRYATVLEKAEVRSTALCQAEIPGTRLNQKQQAKTLI